MASENRGLLFNRGKRLDFPIGVQPVKQVSLDEKNTAKSSEEKLLDAFKGLSDTLRTVVKGNHAKEANQPDEADPVTQNTADHASGRARERANPGQGLGAEGPAPSVRVFENEDRGGAETKNDFDAGVRVTKGRGFRNALNGGKMDYTASKQRPKFPHPMGVKQLKLETPNGSFFVDVGGKGATAHPENEILHRGEAVQFGKKERKRDPAIRSRLKTRKDTESWETVEKVAKKKGGLRERVAEYENEQEGRRRERYYRRLKRGLEPTTPPKSRRRDKSVLVPKKPLKLRDNRVIIKGPVTGVQAMPTKNSFKGGIAGSKRSASSWYSYTADEGDKAKIQRVRLKSYAQNLPALSYLDGDPDL